MPVELFNEKPEADAKFSLYIICSFTNVDEVLIVKFNATVLSQPAAFVPTHVAVLLELV